MSEGTGLRSHRSRRVILGFRTSFGYDAASQRVSVTDALGNISTTVFDAVGRTSATVNASGVTTSQVFDAIGQLIAVVDARGNRSSFRYDAVGRQTLRLDGLGNRVTSQFDAASRRTVRIDGRGLPTSYAYDQASQLVGQAYQDGTRVTNTFDASGQRTALGDWTGSYTSTFDPVGRLSSVVNPAGIAITYGYDAVGQRAWMSQPTGLFSYQFDPAGRISSLINPEGQRTSWQYDAASRVQATSLANGAVASNTYDQADQVLLLANLNSSGTTLSSFNYTYNPVGNRTRIVEANGDVVTLAYDPTYQLTNEMRSGANSYNISYVYDPVGNRTVLANGGALTTNSYNAGNELATSQASTGVTTSAYDGSGNLLTTQAPGNQWTTNTWDGENRLTLTALPSGVVNTFTYNGDGLRVQKQDSTGTTKHVWDGQKILLETDGGNTIQVVYTLQPERYGDLLSQRRSGTTSFYIFNGLGSTTQLLNSGSAITDSYLHDSWGINLLASGSTTNWLRYSGRIGYYFEQDVKAYYVRARLYQPQLGVWLTRDPLLLRGTRVGRYRGAYAYALNNPVRFS